MRTRLLGWILLVFPSAAHAAGPANIEKLARDCQAGKWYEGCVKLMDLARSSPDKAVRSAAIRALTNEEVLFRIVNLAGPLDTRLEALARINDPARLVEVALRTSGDQTAFALRMAAVARITTPADLVRLAKEADESEAAAAVSKLDDDALLADVYQTVAKKMESSANVRPVVEAAIAKMTDQALLAEIAAAGLEYDGKAWLRTLALGRIHEASILLRLAKSASPVAAEAVKNLRDQAAVADAALNAKDIGARAEAINRLGDQSVLARIAKGHPLNPRPAPASLQKPALTWEQDSAFNGLTDRTALTELARSKDLAIARAAAERLAAIKATPVVDATGELYEPRLGQPLAQYRVEVFNANGRLMAETTTDGEGRFHFRGLAPGKWTLVHGPEKKNVEAPTSGGALGRVIFADAGMVTDAFGEVCRSPGPMQRVPAVPLLVLTSTERTAATATWRPDGGSFAWDRAWNAILCLRTTSTVVGRYVEKSGRQTGLAYRVNWNARLVRLQDGRVFESSFAEDPPDNSTGGMAAGNPSASLAAWLKTIE